MKGFLNRRKPLFQWSAWFAFANAIIYWLVGSMYLSVIIPLALPAHVNPSGRYFIYLFIFFTHFGHLALLAGLFCSLSLLPFILAWPKRHFVTPVAVIISTIAVFYLLIDARVFMLYHFHLNTVLFKMIFTQHIQGVFGFSFFEWVIAVSAFIFLLTVESLISYFIFLLQAKNSLVYGKRIFTVLLMCLGYSYVLLIFSIAYNYNHFSVQAKVYPLYNRMVSFFIPTSNGYQRLEKFAQAFFSQLEPVVRPLNYPLKPLACTPPKKPLNIVFILVDTWRFDAITREVMPNVFEFQNNTAHFTQHFSGGNGTKSGIFSLFYGLPSTYWSSVLEQGVSPVFMNQLIKNNYHIGIFASAELAVPAFHKTVFNKIKPLRIMTPGKTVDARDRYITREFNAYLKKNGRGKRPFFAYLFYDSAHGYCSEQDIPKIFRPEVKRCNRVLRTNQTDPKPYLNRYWNSVHFVDSEIGKVLKTLSDGGYMENTVIVISGDHGQEFNDSKQNYWEHASGFSHYQVQTPLLIYSPGETPEKYNYLTSHYDVMPTLMQKFFGCKNPMSDYSVGYGLFNSERRPYTIVGSYINFAIMDDKHITILYPSGTFEVQNLLARRLENQEVDQDLLKKVFADIQRFYQK